ncbi:hypothetical protein TNCV_2982811 [Trichonephila clavipes]|nr:hypothetical protein TNCV_2982811 [Trichonephila clavipes]
MQSPQCDLNSLSLSRLLMIISVTDVSVTHRIVGKDTLAAVSAYLIINLSKCSVFPFVRSYLLDSVYVYGTFLPANVIKWYHCLDLNVE